MATTTIGDLCDRIAALPVWARLVLEERCLDLLEAFAFDPELTDEPDEDKRETALAALGDHGEPGVWVPVAEYRRLIEGRQQQNSGVHLHRAGEHGRPGL